MPTEVRPTYSRPTYSRPTARRLIRSALIALALSIGVGLTISADSMPGHRTVTIELSCAAGLTIWFVAVVLTHLVGERFGRMSRRTGILVRAAIYLISSLAAWAVMLATADLLGVQLGQQAPFVLALTAGLAAAAGFSFYSYDAIRKRLEHSIARLKEAEFAEKELETARQLQSRLLPPNEMDGPGWSAAARNLPALLVAGDFYDVFRLPGERLGLVVADVAGKGMAAALVMATVKAMLPLIAAERGGAAATLRELNRRLAAELPGRDFVALAFALFTPRDGRLEIANAGLPDPYLLPATAAASGETAVGAAASAAGELGAQPLVVPGPRLPLGVRGAVEYVALEATLAPGDRLLLLTDGLPEALVAPGEPLGYGRLAGLIAAARGAVPIAWIDDLLSRVRTATAPILEDDWTALIVERQEFMT